MCHAPCQMLSDRAVLRCIFVTQNITQYLTQYLNEIPGRKNMSTL